MLRFLIHLFWFLFVSFIPLYPAYSVEGNQKLFEKKVSSNTSYETLKPGLYFSIGSFRDLSRAYRLKLSWPNLNPAVVPTKVGAKSYFRVVVGPVTIESKKVIRARLTNSGFDSVWLVRITTGNNFSVASKASQIQSIGILDTPKKVKLITKTKKKMKDQNVLQVVKKIAGLVKTLSKDQFSANNAPLLSNKKTQTHSPKTREIKNKEKYITFECDNCSQQIITPNTDLNSDKVGAPVKRRMGEYFKERSVVDIVVEKLQPLSNTPFIAHGNDLEISVSQGAQNSQLRKKNTTLAKSPYKIGDIFADCEGCPQQVVIPAGKFIMGETDGGLTGDAPETPVTFPRVMAIGRFEVTFEQWGACIEEGGCASYRPSSEGWGRGTRPVINISWHDAEKYTVWLSAKTGHKYRLPSEAEWEYFARAGSTSGYWWGDQLGINQAVCQDCGSLYDGEKTAPIGSFAGNAFGLYDTAGNVWEWTQDCYFANAYLSHKSYPEPVSGSDDCSRVLRGGSWDVISGGIRSSFRFTSGPSNRSNVFGFRVVRELG